jgi:hypothetical protein
MKKISILTNTWCIGLLLFCFFPAVSCSAQNSTSTQKNVPKETTSYTVPEEKAQLWESLKSKTLKEYEVCQEHCGYEQSCLDRCESVYKNRLETEYKRLTE